MELGRTCEAGPTEFKGSLRTKALLLFGATVLLVAIEAALAVLVLRGVERDFSHIGGLDDFQRQVVSGLAQTRDLLTDLELMGPDEERAVLGHWQGDLHVLLEVDADFRERVGDEAFGMVKSLAMRADDLGDAATLWHDSIVALGEDMRDGLGEYANVLLAHLSQVQNERESFAEASRRERSRLVILMTVIGGLGLTCLAVIGIRFLSRLLHSMHLLRQQTERIASGSCPQPLAVDRDDEVGQVVAAVNSMSADLAARDRELANLRDRFSQQERMSALGVFAAQMAHELGNPIQAIMALCLHISDSIREDTSRENVLANLEHIDLIARHAERLTGTVRDIREFGRPERLEKELVDLNEIVGSSVRLMRFEPRFARAHVELQLARALPPLMAVADRLVQVLVNLLINAADAIKGKQGHIVVATAVADDRVRLSVTDDGLGMEPTIQALVFDAFFTTKIGANGTGLGLTICKSIIEDHGGTIAIDSAFGRGTTVTVLLPKG